MRLRRRSLSACRRDSSASSDEGLNCGDEVCEVGIGHIIERRFDLELLRHEHCGCTDEIPRAFLSHVFETLRTVLLLSGIEVVKKLRRELVARALGPAAEAAIAR